MCGLDHKESWVLKNWCFWTVVLEKTLECPLDCKEIQPVNPKGNQLWLFIGRTDAEAEAPILWPPDGQTDSLEKTLMLAKIWKQEEKGMTEDEMIGWHHRLNGHEFEQGSWAGDGQGSLACCSLGGHKELDMTEQLNWIELIWWYPHVVISCVVRRGSLLWPVYSVDKTLLAFALLYFVLQSQICLLTSYFCIPIPYDEMVIFSFFGITSRRSCRSSQNQSVSASWASVVGA